MSVDDRQVPSIGSFSAVPPCPGWVTLYDDVDWPGDPRMVTWGATVGIPGAEIDVYQTVREQLDGRFAISGAYVMLDDGTELEADQALALADALTTAAALVRRADAFVPFLVEL